MTLRQAQDGPFGDKAAQLAGLSAALLGWRPAEFWNSTPAELEAALGLGQQLGEQIDPEAVERLRLHFRDDRGR
jgi:hypothetical protein